MTLGMAVKRPEDVRDYDIDFSRWLPKGDTVQSATAEADEGITVDSVQINDTTVKVWLSGGTSGQSYTVEVGVDTAGGRAKQTCFRVRVRNC